MEGSNLELCSACAFCPAVSKARVRTRTRWNRSIRVLLCLFAAHLGNSPPTGNRGTFSEQTAPLDLAALLAMWHSEATCKSVEDVRSREPGANRSLRLVLPELETPRIDGLA